MKKRAEREGERKVCLYVENLLKLSIGDRLMWAYQMHSSLSIGYSHIDFKYSVMYEACIFSIHIEFE